MDLISLINTANEIKSSNISASSVDNNWTPPPPCSISSPTLVTWDDSVPATGSMISSCSPGLLFLSKMMPPLNTYIKHKTVQIKPCAGAFYSWPFNINVRYIDAIGIKLWSWKFVVANWYYEIRLSQIRVFSPIN